MEQKYIAERVEPQIHWYSQKSQSNKKWFNFLKVMEMLSAGCIPFLIAYSESSEYINIIIGILGVLTVFITGLLSLYKYQENWIEYRTTAESLKHQKFLFENQCSPYDGEERLKNFVQICEGLISKENTNWGQNIKTIKHSSNNNMM